MKTQKPQDIGNDLGDFVPGPNPRILPVFTTRVNRTLDLSSVGKLRRFSSNYGDLDYFISPGKGDVRNYLLVNSPERFKDFIWAKNAFLRESNGSVSWVDELNLLKNYSGEYGYKRSLGEQKNRTMSVSRKHLGKEINPTLLDEMLQYQQR